MFKLLCSNMRVAATLPRRTEPTKESRTDDPPHSSSRDCTLHQVHSAIAVTNSALYMAQSLRHKG